MTPPKEIVQYYVFSWLDYYISCGIMFFSMMQAAGYHMFDNDLKREKTLLS